MRALEGLTVVSIEQAVAASFATEQIMAELGLGSTGKDPGARTV